MTSMTTVQRRSEAARRAARICSSCGNPHDRAGQRYCHVCHAAYQAFHRHKQTIERRIISRKVAGHARRNGRIEREPCMVCGADAQMHHPNHEMPLLVVWLCQEHHAHWHLYSKEAVFKLFCEWIEIARACVAVRDSESVPAASKDRKAA